MSDELKRKIWKTEGAILRRLRKEKGLTQEDLAKLIGSDPRYISSLENGNRGMGKDIKQRLCKRLDVPISVWSNELLNIPQEESNQAKSLIDLDIEQLLAKLPVIKKYDVAKYIRQLMEDSQQDKS